MIDEKLENAKLSLYNSGELEKIKHNPVVKSTMMCLLKSIPILGELIDGVFDEVLVKYQVGKRNELLNIILSDSKNITTEMVNDVEFIMNFLKTVEAIDRLASNDKIAYFGNLLKNGYFNTNKIYIDKFEEYFNAINLLSHRQLALLALLHTYSKKDVMCENEKEIEFKRWILYKEDACNSFNLTEEELISVLKSAEKSGLCKEVVGAIYGYHGGRFEATTVLDDFVAFITSKSYDVEVDH